MAETENITEYRRELRERILETAIREFTRKGVKGVKMDDMVSLLTISKRTLYEIFSNKEVLLLESLKKISDARNVKLKKLVDNSQNVMDIIIQVFKLRIDELQGVNPTFFKDLIKYPFIVRYFEETRKNKRETMLRFLRRGVDEGYFKPEYNYDLVVEAFEGEEKQIMICNLMQDNSIEDIMLNMTFVTLRGICTSKGIDILDRFIASNCK